MPSVLGYWTIRGLGEPIRLLLKYVGEEFEEKEYPFRNPGEEDGVRWFNVKYSQGLDFANLPYYMDGTVKLTQSHAIMKYLGRKYNLVAETEAEITRLDLLEGESRDFFLSFARPCYDPKFQELKDELKKKRLVKLKEFEAFLGDRPWFVGSKLTWLDFFIYETLAHSLCCWPDLLQGYPQLEGFMKRFQELPQLSAYLKSPEHTKKPLYRPDATWGGTWR